MTIIEPVQGILGLLKSKLGALALTAFVLEMAVISAAIKTKRIKQERENKKRISLALTNYSLN